VNTRAAPGEFDLYDCAPDRRQQLLLRAALLEPDAAAAAWRQWCDGGELDDVDSASFRLLPLVYRKLQDAAGDDPLLPRLQVVYRHTWFKNQVLFDAARALLARLAAAGIEAMLLKGAAMSLTHYRDPGLRFMHDLDVLVRPQHFLRAVEVLMDANWGPTGAGPRVIATWHRRRFQHGASFRRDSTEIDLHSQLSRFTWQDDEDIWRHAQRIEWRGTPVYLPDTTVQFYHTCNHGVRWSYGKLSWIPDALAVLRGPAPGVDWERLLRIARHSRTICQLHHSLAYLRHAWDADIPAEVLAQLAAQPVSWVERGDYRMLASRPRRTPGHLAARLFLRSCRYGASAGPAQAPLGVDFFTWIRYLYLDYLGLTARKHEE